MRYVVFAAKVVGALLAPLVLALYSLHWVLWVQDHSATHVSSSPSEHRVAVLHGLGEGEVPGYGSQLGIHSRWAPFKTMWGTPVFRGYCGHPSSLNWKNSTTIELRCKQFSEVHERRTRYDDVRITYVGEER